MREESQGTAEKIDWQVVARVRRNSGGKGRVLIPRPQWRPDKHWGGRRPHQTAGAEDWQSRNLSPLVGELYIFQCGPPFNVATMLLTQFVSLLSPHTLQAPLLRHDEPTERLRPCDAL